MGGAGATEVSTWAGLQEAFTNGGNIRLTAEITAGTTDSALTVPSGKTVTLDLNGHTINRSLASPADDKVESASKKGNAIIVNGTLTVNDTSESKQGKITGAYSKRENFKCGAIYVASGGIFTLNAGSISGNKAGIEDEISWHFGAGVSVDNGGTFTMNGGSISGNHSSWLGGGMASDSNATINLLGGEIEHNTTSGTAGGTCLGGGVAAYGNVTIGGDIVIQNNTAKGTTNNLQFITWNIYLQLSADKPLETSAKIGWTGPPNSKVDAKGIKVAQGTNAKDYLDHFVSDQNSDYIFGLKAGDAETIYCATANSTVVTKPSARKVEITAGQHMTKTQDSGNASQTVTASAITDIVYTAATGYYFPENYVSTISNLTDGALNGITVTRNSDSTITVSGTPTADTTITLKDAAEISEPTFNDGFGNANITSGSYTVDNEYAVGSGKYVFAGWYASADYSGGAVTEFANGTTYYAKWTKNGKTVRTTALDFFNDAASDKWKAGCTHEDTLWTNAAEGWSWDTASQTLTLNGVTIDAQIDENTSGAIGVFKNATIKTVDGTENFVRSRSEEGNSNAIFVQGDLTISGKGKLTVVGEEAGIHAEGNIEINAPITATSTGKTKGCSAIMAVGGNKKVEIKIGSSWSIVTPADGRAMESEGGAWIAAGDKEEPVSNVVIGIAAPTFTDGLGKTDCTFDTYAKGAENAKGYTFAGWFGDDGNELTSAGAAVAGTTYTAKWTKNGKTVRTTALDLYDISTTGKWKAGCTQNGTLWTNEAEGWSWDTASKTLTLNGVTIDIPKSNTSAIAAVYLPHEGTVKSDTGTQNTICNRSGIEGDVNGLKGFGVITIDGSGELSITGKTYGIISSKLTIKAPLLTATAINKEGVAVACSQSGSASDVLTLDSSVSITEPAGGKVCKDDWRFVIGDSNGTPAKEVVIGVAKKYTVTYNTNGGSAVGSATVSEGGKLTEPQAPTKDGYTFHGWYKDAAFTNAWNFGADTVTGNTTLYAKWTEATKIYGISGTVYAYGGATTASDVIVKLMKGDTQVASTTSSVADGTYSFTGIAPGVYNIVAEKDDTTQTTLVIVTNHDETGKNVTLPQSKVNSKLTVNGADTPDVVAGGLDKEAAAVKGENGTATLVKVEMTVESKSDTEVNSADKTNIENKAAGKKLEYLDIKVTKTVDGNESAITKTANMMEIIIPYDMTGKSNITVYRNHNGSAKAFTQLNTLPGGGAVDGTYYLDTANHLIYVYTQKFSTYAIGYNTQSGGGSGSGGSSSGGGSGSGGSYIVRKPEVTANTGGKAELSADGTTATITPDAGYEIESVLLNGKDMGKVTKVTGLKTGDKLVVSFRKAAGEAADMDSRIKAQLSKTWLMARSSYTAKKNVKVIFKTDEATKALLKEIQSAGYTVKYRYFRSLKKSAKKNAASYKTMYTKPVTTYWNTYGQKGKMYYYRVSILVYDKDGKQVAKTNLSQCKYANRLWTK